MLTVSKPIRHDDDLILPDDNIGNEVTNYGYDKVNRQVTLIEAYGSPDTSRTTTTVYDRVGNVIAQENQRFHAGQVGDGLPPTVVTSFVYDKLDRQTEVRGAFNAPANSLGHTSPITTTVYDAVGNRLSTKDAIGRVTTFAYDALDRQVRRYDEWETGTTYARGVFEWYDATDNLVRRDQIAASSTPILPAPAPIPLPDLDPPRVSTTYAYDAMNRQTSVTTAAEAKGGGLTALGLVTSTKYDGAGNEVLLTDANSVSTEQWFDSLGRRTKLVEAKGKATERFTTFTYDAGNRLLSEERQRYHTGQNPTDSLPATVTTSYGYDALDRKVAVIEAYGVAGQARTTTMRYDAADNLVSVFDPLQRETKSKFDLLNRRVETTVAVGDSKQVTSKWTYDAADNVLTEVHPRVYDSQGLTDADSAPVTKSTYDMLNRRVTVTQAFGATQLGHAAPTVTFQYNAVGRVLLEISPARGSDTTKMFAVSSRYDLLDHVVWSAEGTSLADGTSFTPARYSTTRHDGLGQPYEVISGLTAANADVGYALAARPATTTFAYDAAGRVTRESVEMSLGLSIFTDVTYDKNGNKELVSVHRDAFVVGVPEILQNRVTKYEYDALNRGVKQTNAYAANDTDKALNTANLGHTSSVTLVVYNAVDDKIRVTDPRGVVSTFAYDLFGNKVRESQAVSYPASVPSVGFVRPVYTYAYDKADRLLSVTDPRTGSVQTTFGYDALDHKTVVIEGFTSIESRRSDTVYDAAGNVLQVTTGTAVTLGQQTASGIAYNRPAVTNYGYDALGRKRYQSSGVFDFFGSPLPVTRSTYNAAGEVVSNQVSHATQSSFASDVLTTFAYDTLGRSIGSTEVASYPGPVHTSNESGDPASRRVTSAKYDSADNLVWSQGTAASAATAYQYDSLHEKTAVIIAPGTNAESRVTYTYDVWGSRTITQTAQSLVTIAYDSLGRVYRQFINEAHETNFTYDSAGNRTSFSDKIKPSYFAGQGATDAKQVLVSETWQKANITTSSFDPLNRPITVTDPAGKTTTTTYDAASLVTDVTDRNGRRRHFDYDKLNRVLTEQWFPAPGQTLGDTAVQKVKYEYDSSDGVVVSYGETGTGVHTYEHRQTFDNVGQVKADAALFEKNAPLVTYTYDAVGNRRKADDSKGGHLNSYYDFANRLAVRDLTTDSKSMHYEFAYYSNPAGGKLDQVADTSVFVSFDTPVPAAHVVHQYYTAGQILRHSTYAGTSTSDADVLDAYAYVINEKSGLLTREDRDGPSDLNHVVTYTYDNLGQVKTSTRNNDATVPTNFDPSGFAPYGSITNTGAANQSAAINNNNNRPTVIGTPTGGILDQGYDGEGNVVVQVVRDLPGTTVERWEFEYDHRNRMTRAVRGSIVSGQAASTFQPEDEVRYGYDADNQLVERTVINRRVTPNTTTDVTRYLYIGGQVYADLNPNNDVIARYVYQDGVDGPIGRVSANQALLYATDRQGSVGAIYELSANAAPQLQKVLEYRGVQATGRGNQVVAGATSGTPLVADRFEYTGREYDPIARMQFNHARWFDPATGRFMTEDASQDTNQYRYAGNSWPNAVASSGSFFGNILSAGTRLIDGDVSGYASDMSQASQIAGSGIVDWAKGASEWAYTAGGIHKPLEHSSGYNTWYDLAYGMSLPALGLKAIEGAGHFMKGGSKILERAVNGTPANAPTAWVGFAAFTISAGFAASDGGLGPTDTIDTIDKTYGMLKKWAPGTFQNRDWDTASKAYHLLRAYPEKHDPEMAEEGRGFGEGVNSAINIALYFLPSGKAPTKAPMPKGLPSAPTIVSRTKTVGQSVTRYIETAKNLAHRAAQPVVSGGIHGGIGKVLGTESRIYTKAVNWADRNGWKACFAGDVPMRTPAGHVLAKDVREGDLLLSRDEFDPDGLIVAQRVEAVFERFAAITILGVRGASIRTTAEHPFYVESQGWTACHELRTGDVIRLDDGWAAVEGVAETGSWEPVYNFRISAFHTYFVGCDEWGFSVWAHNAYRGELPTSMPTSPKPKYGQPGAAEWRYQRYGYQNRHRPASELKDFDTWKRDHYDPGLNGGRPGRAGGDVQVTAKDQLVERGWQRTETTEHVGHFPDLVQDLPKGGRAFGEVGTMNRNGLPEGREWTKFFTQMMGMKNGNELHFFDKVNVDRFIKVTKGEDGIPILSFSPKHFGR